MSASRPKATATPNDTVNLIGLTGARLDDGDGILNAPDSFICTGNATSRGFHHLGQDASHGRGGRRSRSSFRFHPRLQTRPVCFEDLLASWDGEELVTRFDGPTETWMFIGVHSTVLGPAMGGTRMKAYAAPGDGLSDVLRLSQAMTFKQAAAHLPYGAARPSLPSRPCRHRARRRAGSACSDMRPSSTRSAGPTSRRRT